MNTLMGKLNVWHRLRHQICRAVLVLLTITAFGQISETHAAMSIALIGSKPGNFTGEKSCLCCLPTKKLSIF